jgi:serine protease AprX
MSTKTGIFRALRRVLIGSLLAVVGVSTLASAQTATVTDARKKISADLLREIERPSGQKLNWVKDDKKTGRLIKALVISTNGTEPTLQAMRGAVLASGGSVYYRYMSVPGISMMMPANRVIEFARRSDVASISANRIAWCK